MSGHHCTIPNGASAPGKVFPPLVVQVRVSTRDARSRTGLPTVPPFLAPGGSLPLATGRWQLTMRPFLSTEQVSRCFPPLAGAVGTGEETG